MTNMQSKKASNAVVQLQPVEIHELEKKLAPKPAAATDNKSSADKTNSESEPLTSASSRPAQRNVVLPCFSQSGRERVFAELGLFFEVHPSRFFVLDLRSDTKKLSISFGEPADDSAGSQVVVIEGSPQQIPEIVGLVRAHLLIGVRTELALFDGALLPEALSGVLPLCDTVIMESHLFDHIGGSGWGDGRAALFSELLNGKLSIVDSGWLRLSAVREELRRAYDQCALSEPNQIKISYSLSDSVNNQSLPTVAVLMAGWCCARLGAVRIDPSATGAVAELEDGSKVIVIFVKVDRPVDKLRDAKGGDSERLNGLLTSGADIAGLEVSWRNGRIAISIGGGKISTNTETFADIVSKPIHSERVSENEADTDRWRRYFVIGESITNYRTSLKLALSLFR